MAADNPGTVADHWGAVPRRDDRIAPAGTVGRPARPAHLVPGQPADLRRHVVGDRLRSQPGRVPGPAPVHRDRPGRPGDAGGYLSGRTAAQCAPRPLPRLGYTVGLLA